jgi:hypothetical protein
VGRLSISLCACREVGYTVHGTQHGHADSHCKLGRGMVIYSQTKYNGAIRNAFYLGGGGGGEQNHLLRNLYL